MGHPKVLGLLILDSSLSVIVNIEYSQTCAKHHLCSYSLCNRYIYNSLYSKLRYNVYLFYCPTINYIIYWDDFIFDLSL